MHENDQNKEDEYQQFCLGRLGDPYPLLHRLQEEDPVHWSEPMQSWLLTRYEDVYHAFLDQRMSSQKVRTLMEQLPVELRSKVDTLGKHLSMWVSHTDPPDHTRLRRLVSLAFSPGVVFRMKPHIQQVVDQLIDQVQPGKQMDVIADFAYPLPVIVICELLGIPPDDRQQFSSWVDDIVATTDGSGPERPRTAEKSQQALDALMDYLSEIVEDRRSHPREDLITSLIAVEAEGDKLSSDELFAMLNQLLVGGHDTTTALIGNAVLALFQFPDELEKLRNDPALISLAVEEFLRYETPAPRNTRRALEDLVIGGRKIRAGETILLMVIAANRDAVVFSNPDDLDIARHPNNQLSFGWGPHFCLGAPLARQIAQIAINTLLRRLPKIQLEDKRHAEVPLWRNSMGLRSLERLPVEF